ncbi:AAEL017436-PA [Aedes aegypti]|uniref:AAEL017436-PA n=1 Tax=Aedes aegypti TaxID=7159 RepID=J9HI00_AEDAE|nr:AAEL017436-PA [Aedes aegypti]
MAASFGGVFLIVGIFIGACQADFGLNIEVPALRDGIKQAIGSGVEPLSKTKASITINTNLDESGVLDAVATVIDSVINSGQKVFGATQTAVKDNSTTSKELFSKYSESIAKAMKDLEGTVEEVKVIKHRDTYESIVSYLTTIKNQENELDKVLITISKKVEEAQALQTPITNENIGIYVTPAMVNGVTKRLTSIKSSVDDLSRLLTIVIRKKIEAVKHITSVNTTANEAQKIVVTALNLFKTHAETSDKSVVFNLNSWISSIVTSFSPIINSPETYNKGNISALSYYLDNLNKSSAHFITTASKILGGLQTNTLELLNLQTKLATDILYNTTKAVVFANLTSIQSHLADSCSVEYVDKLKQPSVQVGRLASCLSSETSTLLNYHTILAPLLQQLQNNAIAIGAQQIATCLRRDGPCSSVYFSAYDGLSLQVVEQLNNLKNVLGQEIQFTQDRVDLCIRATTADIADNLKTLLTKYDECLHRNK